MSSADLFISTLTSRGFIYNAQMRSFWNVHKMSRIGEITAKNFIFYEGKLLYDAQ